MGLVLRAALADLWFVTIHPFDDGNGRIARAVADMALARTERNPQRFYSMSAQIRIERKAYYDILEATQKGDLDITVWQEPGQLQLVYSGQRAMVALDARSLGGMAGAGIHGLTPEAGRR